MPQFIHTEISQHIWETKYRHRDEYQGGDNSLQDTWRRVARALAAAEPHSRDIWERRFYRTLTGFKFLPGGRILAGAGTQRRVTLFNCFVMGTIEDSMEAIFDHLKEGALTMQQGGGVGYDFSTLRPKGTQARGVGATASGPVSFMTIWDAMCATILSTGARRGAMMSTLRCDHPDIEDFITAKWKPGKLRHFNLSVLILDDFMKALREDQDWPLVFPDSTAEPGPDILKLRWSGTLIPVPCRILRKVRARSLWHLIMESTYQYAEPGVLFIDRINDWNNLAFSEYITATNPCGEVPLPPYGSCNLGSLNLTTFIRNPFTNEAYLDLKGIERTVSLAVRMLDNVIDVSRFPLSKQKQYEKQCRRLGLGITGLADTLIMLNLHYGSEEARETAATVMRTICHAAYRASIALAREKGVFPIFDRDKYLSSRFIATLPDEIQESIARYGIRNSHLLAIAPTGTISLLANNISSGLEPVFDFHYRRKVLDQEGRTKEFLLEDFAYRLWKEQNGPRSKIPSTFVDSRSLSPYEHLAMQAALQPYVDNSISKTIQITENYPFELFKDIYTQAYELGLKGCTTYRHNPITGAVLTDAESHAEVPHCCTLERETD